MPLLIYQAVVLSFVVSLLLLLLGNMVVLPTLDKNSMPTDDASLVSILVPARNEEANIETCIRSLLAQSYPHFELLVLDDQSTDGTSEILAKLATDSRLHVLNGGPLLPGWLGKANACRQLAEAAKGKYLLFTDADTVHHPASLAAAMALMLPHNKTSPPASSFFAPRVAWGLLSMFPRQITGTWSERLIIPLMHFAVYALLPLPGAFRLRSAAFAAANGQFMLFSRAAYDAAGGHDAVRSQVLEDVALSRAIKGVGYAAVLVDGGDLVSTRMYHGLDELWAGFSKNLFAFFGNSLPFLVIGMTGYAILYVLPLIWSILGLMRLLFGPTLDTIDFWAFIGLPLLQYAFAVLTRLVLARRFGFSYGWSFLHPISIAMQIGIAFNSARLHRRGGAAWKGRRVV